MSVVGIDIGGANLKASDGMKSLSVAFPLWKHPEQLTSEIARLLTNFHPYGPIAATMTGELADCFRTRAEGVKQIIESLISAAPQRQLFIWQTGGEFFSAEDAIEFPELVAAANWHALATWAGRACPSSSAILIDIGSTTTDIIPIDSGVPTPAGTTDLQRLCSGELVYSGVRRTPLFAIAQTVELRGEQYPIAAELFATTLDLAILLQDLPEAPLDCGTANSRPAIIAESCHRLARMFCSDCDQLNQEDMIAVAQQIQDYQLRFLSKALQRVLERQQQTPRQLILSGEGEFLSRKLLKNFHPNFTEIETLSLNMILGSEQSQAACAYALAKLGVERL